jgi:hypothetical protein
MNSFEGRPFVWAALFYAFGGLMPYKVKTVGGQSCVCDESGKPIKGGCHGKGASGRIAANRHMRALYANVPDAKLEYG